MQAQCARLMRKKRHTADEDTNRMANAKQMTTDIRCDSRAERFAVTIGTVLVLLVIWMAVGVCVYVYLSVHCSQWAKALVAHRISCGLKSAPNASQRAASTLAPLLGDESFRIKSHDNGLQETDATPRNARELPNLCNICWFLLFSQHSPAHLEGECAKCWRDNVYHVCVCVFWCCWSWTQFDMLYVCVSLPPNKRAHTRTHTLKFKGETGI